MGEVDLGRNRGSGRGSFFDDFGTLDGSFFDDFGVFGGAGALGSAREIRRKGAIGRTRAPEGSRKGFDRREV